MSKRLSAKAMKRIRQFDMRTGIAEDALDTEKRIRVNVYMRPKIVKFLDSIRDSSGVSRSLTADVLLGWILDDMVEDKVLERQYGDGVPGPLYKQKSPKRTRSSRKEDDSSLPYPDMEVDS